jgi:hypothetical protein
VRADNDAFNFWQPIVQRADREYTNGDIVTVELAAAPWWGKHFARNRSACNGLEAAGDRCLTTSIRIGQDMYTPRPDHEPGIVPDWRDERPYAAWLYGGVEGRVIDERRLRTVGIELGVTGPPAAGEFAQRTAHKLTGVYSREPVGWNTQIGFELGVVLTGKDTWRFAARSASGNVYADFTPHVGASLGTSSRPPRPAFRSAWVRISRARGGRVSGGHAPASRCMRSPAHAAWRWRATSRSTATR